MKQAMKTEKPVVEAAAYEPPCMTVVPIRTSGMLCVSGSPLRGGSPYGEDPELIDFEASNSSETEAIRNGQFGDWSNDGERSFF